MRSDQTDRMRVDEFRRLGYLQEVNRRFFHPLGLALEVLVDDQGVERFGGIWDSRSDPDGIRYAPGVLDDAESAARARWIDVDLEHRLGRRLAELGYGIQPIPADVAHTCDQHRHPDDDDRVLHSSRDHTLPDRLDLGHDHASESGFVHDVSCGGCLSRYDGEEPT